MKKDDYGFYGKGIDGYVHYKQAFEETQKEHPRSRRSHPPATGGDNSFDRLVTWVLGPLAVIIIIAFLVSI
ncbi:MAG: hypothetical protein ACI4PV_04400 [Butyricicoccus sp.]